MHSFETCFKHAKRKKNATGAFIEYVLNKQLDFSIIRLKYFVLPSENVVSNYSRISL